MDKFEAYMKSARRILSMRLPYVAAEISNVVMDFCEVFGTKKQRQAAAILWDDMYIAITDIAYHFFNKERTNPYHALPTYAEYQSMAAACCPAPENEKEVICNRGLAMAVEMFCLEGQKIVAFPQVEMPREQPRLCLADAYRKTLEWADLWDVYYADAYREHLGLHFCRIFRNYIEHTWDGILNYWAHERLFYNPHAPNLRFLEAFAENQLKRLKEMPDVAELVEFSTVVVGPLAKALGKNKQQTFVQEIYRATSGYFQMRYPTALKRVENANASVPDEEKADAAQPLVQLGERLHFKIHCLEWAHAKCSIFGAFPKKELRPTFAEVMRDIADLGGQLDAYLDTARHGEPEFFRTLLPKLAHFRCFMNPERHSLSIPDLEGHMVAETIFFSELFGFYADKFGVEEADVPFTRFSFIQFSWFR